MWLVAEFISNTVLININLNFNLGKTRNYIALDLIRLLFAWSKHDDL